MRCATTTFPFSTFLPFPWLLQRYVEEQAASLGESQAELAEAEAGVRKANQDLQQQRHLLTRQLQQVWGAAPILLSRIVSVWMGRHVTMLTPPIMRRWTRTGRPSPNKWQRSRKPSPVRRRGTQPWCAVVGCRSPSPAPPLPAL